MTAAPQVSVIIPAYNYARYLPVTLRSVLLQEGVRVEIIVVDDASTDNTPEVLADFGERITVIRQENAGPAAARNTGLRHATGETVVFLDADDLLMPGVLASQYGLLQTRPDVSMVSCLNQEVMADSAEAPLRPKDYWPRFADNEAVHLCHFNMLPIHSVMCRMAVCREVGFFDQSLRACEDHDYWLRCAVAGHLPLVNPHALVLYRKHKESLSSRTSHEYLHNVTLHHTVYRLLQEHPQFPVGQRLEAWLAHAAGCLTTGLRLYNAHPEQAHEALQLAVQGLKRGANEPSVRGRKNGLEQASRIADWHALHVLEHLEILLSHGLQDFAVAKTIVLRLFPHWNLNPRQWQQARQDMFPHMYVPQQLITDFSALNALVLPDAVEFSPPPLPRISVIMATFNAEACLRRGLNAFASQTYADKELVVQDGGSTDGTLSILRDYAPHIGHLASEKDSGVYNAWNRALVHVTGEWTLFLGADDFFPEPGVLAACAPHLAALPQEVVFAYGVVVQVRGKQATYVFDRSLHEVMCLFPSNMGLPFPATFVRTAFLKTHGFDESYRIAGDFAFAARHITLANTRRLPVHVSYMEDGGLSASPLHATRLLDERRRVLREEVLPRADAIVRACMDSVGMDEKLW